MPDDCVGVWYLYGSCIERKSEMTKEEILRALKEIQQGKEGQLIPYNVIRHAITPLKERGCLQAAIYLLEHIED